MHAVLLGVYRQFPKCWFQSNDNDNNNGRFRHHLNTLNELINSYQPTSDASRIPQSISEVNQWKAHEMCLWLLNYSLVTIKGMFPQNILIIGVYSLKEFHFY